jgi:hypothetical protein
MSEGLLRQRRNLILTAVLLWLMKFGGVKFSKFSLAGFDVEFARPEALTICLWIAFFYFLYRYYQYFVPEGIPKLQADFENTLNRYAQTTLDRYVFKQEPDWSKGTRTPLSVLWKRHWVYEAESLIRDPDGVARKTQPFEIKVPWWKFVHLALATMLNLLIRTSLATDYLLPLVLAGYVLWYCGTAEWSGSFLNILLTP